MKWLEIIELQSIESDYELLNKTLEDIMNTINLGKEAHKVTIYRNGKVKTDFSLHLYHDSEHPESRGSKLGLSLTSALRKCGLVNHNIWIERSKVQ